MALNRNSIREWLEEAGIAEDKIGGVTDKIINGHSATVDALKEERDNYKTDAEQLQNVQKELNDLQKTVKEATEWKGKYDALILQNARAEKRGMMAEALEAAGVSNKQARELILNSVNFEEIEIDGGKIKDADAAVKPYKEQFGDFFESVETLKNKIPNKPQNDTTGKGEGEPKSLLDALRSRYENGGE